ncbi:TPA: hypothetical protein ACX6S2_003629 [Photobacterium damselae]
MFIRYETNTLVIGQVGDGGNGEYSALNYILYLFGFTHTGYLNYTFPIAIAIWIYIISNNKLYIYITMFIYVYITFITTQKSYLLYVFISIIIYRLWVRKLGLIENIKYAVILIISPAVIFILNALRNLKLESGSGILDYFSIDTIVWYLSIRLDYALSTSYIVGSNFETSASFVTNCLKSLLFFVPKSYLFDGPIYSIKLAHFIGFSSNDLAGITITGFGQVYDSLGSIGLLFFCVIFGVLLSSYSKILNAEVTFSKVITIFILLPVMYFGLVAQAIPELIYTILRNIFSLNLFLMVFCLLDKIFDVFKKTT